jgi:outer membrane lipoprotein-sorting protein
MKMTSTILASLLLTPGIAAGESPQHRGLRIVQEIDRANAGFAGEQWQLTMTLINAHGDAITRQLAGKVKEVASDGDKTVLTFVSPRDVRGTRLLTWSRRKSDDDQWLYMPSFRQVKRLNASNRTGSFMGSEFAYEDFNSPEVERYSYRYLETGKVAGRAVWVIEQYPARKSGYSKLIVWYDQQFMNPLRIDYYDHKSRLLKVSHFKEYRRHGRYWRPRSVHMINKQTGKKTVLAWSQRTIGARMPDEEFAKEYLDEE